MPLATCSSSFFPQILFVLSLTRSEPELALWDGRSSGSFLPQILFILSLTRSDPGLAVPDSSPLSLALKASLSHLAFPATPPLPVDSVAILTTAEGTGGVGVE